MTPPSTESLSVAVTCYNHAAFIVDTLQSVLDQARQPDEIVVIDDVSTDGSADLIERVAATSPVPMRLIRRTANSGGPARPTNEVVAATRGDLVALVEGDDACTPGRLQAQFDALQRVPDATLCFGLSETIDRAGKSMPEYRITKEEVLSVDHRHVEGAVYLLSSASLYRHLLEHRNVAASFSNMMIRRTAWNRVHGIREKYRVCLDLDFVLRCAAAGPVVLVSEVTCVHRLHGANAGGTSGIRNRRDLITLKADHAAHPGVAGAIPDLQRQLPDLLMTQGYWEARDGMLGASMGSYLRAANAGASKARAFLSGVKAVPHAVAAWVGIRRTP